MLPLVVISYYDRRPVGPLLALLDSLDRHDPGVACERVVCVNRTHERPLPAAIGQRVQGMLERPNRGMNIGAWNAGSKHWPGRPAYLFLQDECYAVRDGWMSTIMKTLDESDVGLVGEAFNPAWDRPWSVLRDSVGRDVLPEHMIGPAPANRVDLYLQELRRHGIDPGSVGRHLRALVWAVRGEVIEALNGFPEGGNYGECIAAEIGVSRAVEARGLSLRQVGATPFHAFRHREWNQDRAGGNYTHSPVYLMEQQQLRQQVAALSSRLEQPTWRDLMRGVRTRLRTDPRRGPR